MRTFRPGHFQSGNFFARGLAQSYAAGRAHIRRLNAERKADAAGTTAQPPSPDFSASKLTDSSGVIAATDTGRKPASTQPVLTN